MEREETWDEHGQSETAFWEGDETTLVGGMRRRGWDRRRDRRRDGERDVFWGGSETVWVGQTGQTGQTARAEETAERGRWQDGKGNAPDSAGEWGRGVRWR